MKQSQLRNIIREEVRNVLIEGTSLIATADRDVQLIINYFNSIGIKPVYPRYFTGLFDEKRELDVDMTRDNKPFTKEYAALENNQTKFRQMLQKANVPDKPVLVCMYQDKFGSYGLGIYNTSLKQRTAALTSNTKDFQSFIIK